LPLLDKEYFLGEYFPSMDLIIYPVIQKQCTKLLLFFVKMRILVKSTSETGASHPAKLVDVGQ